MTSAAPPDPFAPPPSAFHAVAPDGEIFIWLPRPDIVAEKASGGFSLTLAQDAVEFLRPLSEAGGRLLVFADFDLVTRYTREARDFMTAYSIAHIDTLGALHMLISSKLVALGLSTYKHEIGDPLVHSYSERASFLRSYDQAMRG